MKIPKDAIAAAAYVFERANGNLLGEHERSEIAMHKMENCDPELLSDDLQRAILDHTGDESGYKAQAYWALGKRFDRRLITFFRERLAIELRHDIGAVYQIMIALDNLEEPVFSASRSGSYSILDSDLNRRDAKSYLNDAH